ncbi:MAG: 4Fe-4S binding protein [Candidatus Caenarcaniphilales bacterium]|nr:4Fe-4S binding protein [Candidatus Caenarcaniphilales bacterium]
MKLLKQESAIQSLKDNKYHKLIIGASLKDLESIEFYAYCFTHAGADVIDISAFAHSVIAAKKGIEKALTENPKLNKPEIMLSVNISQDPHFRIVKLDKESCTECEVCIPACPSEAFFLSPEFTYNPDLCFGCSNCLDYCPVDALSFENWNPYNPDELNRLLKMGARSFEIHLSKDFEAFREFYRAVNLENVLIESFSIGSELLSKEELIQAKEIILEEVYQRPGAEERIVIIQTDGIPQSGARIKNQEKDLKAIENAKILIDSFDGEIPNNLFIQIAGGINDESLSKAHRLRVPVNGVAIGSWIRNKIIDLDPDTAKDLSKEILKKSKHQAC